MDDHEIKTQTYSNYNDNELCSTCQVSIQHLPGSFHISANKAVGQPGRCQPPSTAIHKPRSVAVDVTVIHTSATCALMQMSALGGTWRSTAWPINPARVRNEAFTMRVQPHLFNLITHTIPGHKSLSAINSDSDCYEL